MTEFEKNFTVALVASLVGSQIAFEIVKYLVRYLLTLRERGVWKALFLDNGHVYFGKVKRVSNEYVNLEKIYYLTLPAGPGDYKPIKEDSVEGGLQLKKLGSEIHKPSDLMVITKSHIIFWEPMDEGSGIVQDILKREM